MKFSTLVIFLAALFFGLVMVVAESGLGKYIVVFEKGLDTPENIVKDVEKKLTGLGGTITYEYNTVLRGFAVTIPTDVMETFQKEEMTSLQNDKFPFYIEKDQVVSINNDDDGKN